MFVLKNGGCLIIRVVLYSDQYGTLTISQIYVSKLLIKLRRVSKQKFHKCPFLLTLLFADYPIADAEGVVLEEVVS